MNEFHEAYSQADLLYDLDISPETFEELGLIAWNKINNKQYRLYKYVAEIDKTSLTVELPCNCDEIEAVTYSFEDWNYTTNFTVNGDYQSQFIEQYIEGRKLYSSPFYISGKYAKYQRVGDTLYFDKDYGSVMILYKGVVLDDDGLPYLNPKEVDAIACYIAMTVYYKKGLQTGNQLITQQALDLKREWSKLCDAARIAEHISQNEMNEILDAKTSWNRKVYGKSLKPLV